MYIFQPESSPVSSKPLNESDVKTEFNANESTQLEEEEAYDEEDEENGSPTLPSAENEQNTEYKVQNENLQSTTSNTNSGDSAMHQQVEANEEGYDDKEMYDTPTDQRESAEWTDVNKQPMFQEQNQHINQDENQEINQQMSHEENKQTIYNQQIIHADNQRMIPEENQQIYQEDNQQMIQEENEQMMQEDNRQMIQMDNEQMIQEVNELDVKNTDEQQDDEDQDYDEAMEPEEEHQSQNEYDNGKSFEHIEYDQQNSMNPVNNENGTNNYQLPSDKPITSQAFEETGNYDNSYSNDDNRNQITADNNLSNADIETTNQINKDDDDLKSIIDDLTNDMVTQLNSMASTTTDDNLDQNSCNAVDNTTESAQFSCHNSDLTKPQIDAVTIVTQPPPPQQTSPINDIDLSSVNVPTLADELKLLEDISDDSLGDMSSQGEDSRNIDWELERRLLDDVPN